LLNYARLVNDPETDEYVRWNDAGTSFIIPNSQLMAENVLPRSFKTINFASFVRQLNSIFPRLTTLMLVYGFHKVPHLNDGALHTENSLEIWEFTNEHFTRNKPDLPSIVRKKNEAEKARSAKRQGSPDPRPRQAPIFPAIEAPPTNTTNTNPGDMSVVYEEIRNIKRLQNSVIGELKRLKTDNEALWTEAAEARQRYDQQQSTINKMLKFLSTVFSPNKSNAGSLPSRNRGLLTGPSAFEELADDPAELGNSVLTPEAQETGARELSNLFGGQQPILPMNAGDATWWQNLIKNGNDSGMFNNIPTPAYTPQNAVDNVAAYVPPPIPLNQHRNSLAAMEQAVNQTDQSIGRISNVLGVNDWDTFNFANFQGMDGLSMDPTAMEIPIMNAQPEYRFDDFLRSMSPNTEYADVSDTDENGTILDQNEEDVLEQPENTEPRFESLSREVSPKPKDLNGMRNANQQGARKRTRSQTGTQNTPPLLKRAR
jgi:hypothetical protein